MEYCDGNDLDFQIKQNGAVPEKEAKCKLVQVVKALKYVVALIEIWHACPLSMLVGALSWHACIYYGMHGSFKLDHARGRVAVSCMHVGVVTERV